MLRHHQIDFRGASRGLLILTALASLGPAASARAANLCVATHPDCPSGAVLFAGVQAALNHADTGSSGKDTLFIGEGSFTAGGTGFVYSSPDELDIIGAGPSETTLRGPTLPSATTLRVVSSSLNDVESLHIDMPVASSATGLALQGDARSISVSGESAATTSGNAVMLDGTTAATIEDATISTVGAGVTGIDVFTSGAVTIEDTKVTSGFLGIEGINNGPLSIHRASVAADRGAITQGTAAGGSTTLVTNSVLRLTDQAAIDPSALHTVGAGTIAGDQLTMNGGGAGTGAAADGASAGLEASITLDNSIMSSFNLDLRANCSGGGTAKITATYSRFTSSAQTPACGLVQSGAGNTAALPDFAAFTGPSPQLRWDSALIDAGRPGNPASTVDHAGAPRLRDGDGDGDLRRDMGAREYQRLPPSVTAKADPIAAAIGAPITFSPLPPGVVNEPGDFPIQYLWQFDDGSTATTETVSHAFSTAGDHNATLMVTDPTGLSTSDSVAVQVSQSGSADSDPPETSIKKSKSKTRDRTPKFRFSSDEPGSSFQCRIDKKKYRPCEPPYTLKRQSFRRHRLAVFATDASGNADPSPAKRRFNVVRG